MKEILNTLHEIEETALKLLITIDKDKQMILDEYSKDYEVFLEQENKKRQANFSSVKSALDIELKQEEQLLRDSHKATIQTLETILSQNKHKTVSDIIANILSLESKVVNER